ncbi:DNA-binding MarR family transcriptional regulator [Microbacterium halimionae]|uniref:DNA-binding MarR family transcriptional regulator n=1 Tax=Microbacterium halimionae TaxID=1526413 RepID=A0A7W3PKN4_9MICO|nr:MarR family transcriptional regulator [Microbacterium halimionae]MBA8815670.1 DNA-binding MarR family transcriptional regulator [Microbacterium halimionae]NII95716.1 DNA-binding MarR family transcriptional regulator [Microbacterium halimionae]
MDATFPDDRVAHIQREWARERPDLDPSPQGLIGRLHRLALALTEELTEVYDQFGLTEAEFDLLASLRRTGAPYAHRASDLAAHTMVTSGGLTKRVDRLIERGLVERAPSQADARQRIVQLTPAGLTLIDDAFSAHMANEHRLVGQLDPADRAALEPLLARWLGLFETR